MTEIRPDLNPLRASGQARPYRGHERGPLSRTVSDLRAISISQTASPSYAKVFPPSPPAISTDSVTAEPVRRLAPLSISSKPRNEVRSFLDELVDERVEKSLCSIKLIPDELRDELLKRSARARRWKAGRNTGKQALTMPVAGSTAVQMRICVESPENDRKEISMAGVQVEMNEWRGYLPRD